MCCYAFVYVGITKLLLLIRRYIHSVFLQFEKRAFWDEQWRNLLDLTKKDIGPAPN